MKESIFIFHPSTSIITLLLPARGFAFRFVRLRGDAQVGLQCLPAAWEFLFGLLVRKSRDDDAVVAVLPVDGRGDAVLGRQLQRVYDAQDFVEVPARARRVGN